MSRLARCGMLRFQLLVLARGHAVVSLRQTHDLQIFRRSLLRFLDLLDVDLFPLRLIMRRVLLAQQQMVLLLHM